MATLNRATSVAVGLGVVGLVAVTYGQFCPKLADIRVARPNDYDAAAAEKAARWSAGALVVLVSVIARDATVFVMGGASVIIFSWQHRYANHVDPGTGAVIMPSSRQMIHAGDGAPAGYAASR